MSPSPDLLESLQTQVGRDLERFLPECFVGLSVLLPVAARLVRPLERIHAFALSAPLLAVALAILLRDTTGTPSAAFTGLLILDPLATFFRTVLLIFALLALALGALTGIPDREDAADYNALLLGGTLGMMLMTSANHLLMVFLALEMASLPSYALAGFRKGVRAGSESALKYVLFGAVASGVALYGMSLLVAQAAAARCPRSPAPWSKRPPGEKLPPLALVGFMLMLVGLAFKLSAVPFHWWCPDVFEGALAEVGAFLSTASKAAAIGLATRLMLTLQHEAAVHAGDAFLQPLALGWVLLAGATATLGNLAALAQTNLKRMLAYSTIAQAGYMIMGVASFPGEAAASVLYYAAAYLPANLGAFAIVAFLRNSTGDETLQGVRGLIGQSPMGAIALTIFLLSLLGLPPLAGFAGKFQVFTAVYHAGARPGWLGTAFYVLLGVGVVNTVISAGFYLKVLRAAVLDEVELPWNRPWNSGQNLLLLALLAVVVYLGLDWNALLTICYWAVEQFLNFSS